MPEISRFYGIVIRMFFDDHEPAHFHAEYAEDEAVMTIGTLAVIAGKLPPRALAMVSSFPSKRTAPGLAESEKSRTPWMNRPSPVGRKEQGNVSRTAEAIGLERSHLYRKMKALGITARD